MTAHTETTPSTAARPRGPVATVAWLGLAIIAYDLIMSVVAWLMGWPPQFGGNPDPGQSYLSYLFGGSAVSAPTLPLVTLMAGVVAFRRPGRWRTLGLGLVTLVVVMFTMGVFGEFAAEHPHTPLAVVYGFGIFRLAFSAALLAVASHAWRTRSQQPG